MQLNSVRLRPQQDHASGRWLRGEVQVPASTQLLVDETELQSGHLGPRGVDNMQAGLGSACLHMSSTMS